MRLLKQSTSVTLPFGHFVDDTDGKTLEEATLTLTQADVRLSKNGGTFAQKSETSTSAHMEKGFYAVALNTTDTNTLGILTVAVAETGALPITKDFLVVPANVYESLVTGTEFLEVTDLKPDVSIVGTTLTVDKTDGTTAQFTKTITTNAAAEPIVGLD